MDKRIEERMAKIEGIKKLIAKEPLEKEQLIAVISLNWGTSRKTVLEYLNTLFYAGIIKLENGKYKLIKTDEPKI